MSVTRYAPRSLTFAAALVALSSPASVAFAQDGMTLPPGMGQSAPSDSESRAQELQSELMQIDAKLRSIQEGVLAQPEIKKEEGKLRDAVTDAVRKLEPDAPKHEARLDQIRTEIQAAQQSDPAKAQALMQEGQALVSKLQDAQAKALDQPELKKRLDAFEKNLLAAMKKSDPEAKRMLDRRDELVGELRKLMGS